ncbi:hypothetical protein VPNG_02765 [Cytospora leucostoma]|uniref:DUF676 domain-containing protein n=1 Tax=Cytospora leucostoma TaxID=1230097 RepID=A0A423XJ88_9PEZI|nr:hypothetical protein VPNG_02765 [Cytospora leucostoma]
MPWYLSTLKIGLTVLHAPDDDKSALVDIITVHGLSGHPQKTWTNLDTEHYWPSNSLTEDIPRSRIMTFGYDTSISPLDGNTAMISDISTQLISQLINKRTSDGQRQRPIIFIAHSLGGIVIKEFLHIASNTGHEALADCVCGILFLGTPHKGSCTATFMDVVSAVLKPHLGRPANIVIKDLSRNSRHLQELDQLLRFKLAKIDIYSFYELLPMNPTKSPIVEKHLAVLNMPSELEQIGLDADHRQMCKPSDRHHVIYETIIQRILSVMDRQIDKVKNFVNGVQKLMSRTKSLQDLLLEAERQNERRKAQALIEAERKISAQRLQTLATENSRLKTLLLRARNDSHLHDIGRAQYDREPPATDVGKVSLEHESDSVSGTAESLTHVYEAHHRVSPLLSPYEELQGQQLDPCQTPTGQDTSQGQNQGQRPSMRKFMQQRRIQRLSKQDGQQLLARESQRAMQLRPAQ